LVGSSGSMPLGVYIHIPFCLKRCPYCSFFSVVSTDKTVFTRYYDALIREIERFPSPVEVDTIYFGGGTPSIFPVEFLSNILTAVSSHLKVLPGAEITLEANPHTLDKQSLRLLLSSGFNRISIGAQSFSDRVLSILGRLHSADEAEESFFMAREAGFDNISLDIIYGIQTQTTDELLLTLDKVISLSPEHISTYALTLEEGCVNGLCVAPPEESRRMYHRIVRSLGDVGYSHYEVSNFAREGFFSRHNLKYWSQEEYIGFGASASSHLSGKRWKNPADIESYIAGCPPVVDTLSKEKMKDEFFLLRLRKTDGFSANEFEQFFREDIADFLAIPRIQELVDSGYLAFEGGRLFIPAEHLFVSDEIIVEVMSSFSLT